MHGRRIFMNGFDHLFCVFLTVYHSLALMKQQIFKNFINPYEFGKFSVIIDNQQALSGE